MPDPRPELDTPSPSYQILENTLRGATRHIDIYARIMNNLMHTATAGRLWASWTRLND